MRDDSQDPDDWCRDAAPEMRAALLAVLKWSEAAGGVMGDGMNAETHQIVIDALTHALGRTP